MHIITSINAYLKILNLITIYYESKTHLESVLKNLTHLDKISLFK